MCDVYPCTCDDKEKTVEVSYAGKHVATLCQECLAGVDGVQILLKRQPDQSFALEHVNLLDSVL